MKKRIIYLILVVVWMVVVFSFSNQRGDESQQTSDVITKTVVKIFWGDLEGSELADTESLVSFAVRKIAHFSIYFLGGFLIFAFLNTFEIELSKKLLFTIIWGFLFSCSDELHQMFVDGRAGQFMDIIIDTMGITWATLFRYWLVDRKAGMEKEKDIKYLNS